MPAASLLLDASASLDADLSDGTSAPLDEAPVHTDSFLMTSGGLALGGGLILLGPLASAALTSHATLAILLAGLGVLGLIAALVRPALHEVDPP